MKKAEPQPYVKKPTISHAVQWNKKDDVHFGGHIDYSELIDGYDMDGVPVIYTLESKGSGHHGRDGDFIMVGIRGERYFCEQSIFYDSYTPVSE